MTLRNRNLSEKNSFGLKTVRNIGNNCPLEFPSDPLHLLCANLVTLDSNSQSTGLAAGGLVKKFGARFCLMTCGIISSTGLVVCACATKVHVLFLGLIFSGEMIWLSVLLT